LPSGVSLMSILGLKKDKLEVRQTAFLPPKKDETVQSFRVPVINWQQLADDRCLTPAHELAMLKSKDTRSNGKASTSKKSAKKVTFQLEEKSKVKSELASDLHVLWKQLPSELPTFEDESELANAEVGIV
jgi:hypothetical protein